MTIGCNESDIDVWNDNDVRTDYIYIKNKGNKHVSMFGVKVGMSLKKARSYLQKRENAYCGTDTKGKTETYWFGDAACVKIVKRNNKVRTITYICAPTG